MTPLHTALLAVLGAQGVTDDPAALALAGSDILTSANAVPPSLVLRPRTTAAAAAAMRVLADAGVCVVPRGAGLSYTGGVVPSVAGVVIDTAGLDAVAVYADDLFAVVGAGCSWAALATALQPHGLRPAVEPPISGSHATVGGAMSQGVAGADGFIGAAIVLADGSVVRTGSWTTPGTVPFTRYYGPDLTGLFIGDGGAFGVKTEIVLRLVPAGIRRFASFGFDRAEDVVDAMIRLRRGPGGRALAFDRARATAAADGIGVTEAVRTAVAVMSRAGSLAGALRGVMALGRAKGHLTEPAWCLHLTAEGATPTMAGAQLDAMRAVCRKAGRQIPPAVPQALDARPFSIRGLVGREGERWVPVHGILPLSSAQACLVAVGAVLDRHADAIRHQGIQVNWLLMSTGDEVTMEPMFYWPDALEPLHLRFLSLRNRGRFAHVAPNPAARDCVRMLRVAVRDAMDAHGAAHNQIGRFYAPPTGELLQRIKTGLDPDRRMNPGVLGL